MTDSPLVALKTVSIVALHFYKHVLFCTFCTAFFILYYMNSSKHQILLLIRTLFPSICFIIFKDYIIFWGVLCFLGLLFLLE